MTSRLTLRRVLGSGASLETRARARAARLAELNHAGVLVPDRIEVEPDGRVVAHVPFVDGRDMAELSRERAPLATGELVWWGQRVALAVAALHEHGLIHGDLSPRNIVVGHQEVTVVDTMAAVLDSERGTAGFRAPEVVAGDTCEASDVYALGRLLKWCADDDAVQRVVSVTTAMTAPDPHQRPRMAHIPELLGDVAPAQPLADSTAVDVASALRNGAHEHTVRMARGRAWRARTWALRAGVGAGVLGVAATLWWGATSLIAEDVTREHEASPAVSPTQTEPSTTTPADTSGADDPEQVVAAAAQNLTLTRFTALAAGDGAALLATVTGDSAFTASVRAQAEALDSGALSYEGVHVSDIETHTSSISGESAQVHLSYTVSEHLVRKRDAQTGAETETVRAQVSEEVVLTLERSTAGDGVQSSTWLVASAQPSTSLATAPPEPGALAAG